MLGNKFSLLGEAMPVLIFHSFFCKCFNLSYKTTLKKDNYFAGRLSGDRLVMASQEFLTVRVHLRNMGARL